MASKYAGLRGKIPEQMTERQEDLKAALARRANLTVALLTEEYNTNALEIAKLAEKVKAASVTREALEILIRERLDAQDADAIKVHGFTWSSTCEPYPVAEDPAAIIKYFREKGMEDQLLLKSSELASRLKTFVKEEALANELEITVSTDPATGEEVRVVRSKIPGVRVFLKSGLSRVKSSK